MPERLFPMHVRAWGLTDADVDRAIDKVGQSRWRDTWQIVETERLTSPVCPLSMTDGNAVAADADYGWAYVVYHVRGARP